MFFSSPQSRANKVAKLIAKRKFAAAEKMLSAGAGVDGVYSSFQCTSLICAVKNNNHGLLQLLVAKGANVNTADKDGDGALNYWLYGLEKGQRFEMARLLIALGADVNAQSKNQRTALIRAVETASPLEVITLLLDSGADIDARNNSGQTALAIAVNNENAQIVKLLLARGASPVVVSREELSASKMIRAAVVRQEAGGAEWKKTGNEEIARISNKPQIGYLLTEIFNFDAELYTVVARNTVNDQESVAVRNISAFESAKLVQQAAEELARAGGNPGYAFSLPKPTRRIEKRTRKGGLDV